MDDVDWKSKLSEEQYHVLREKGTEAPFSGEFLYHDEAGSYLCAGCGNKVFSSEDKFDAHCGWPSFSNVASNTAVQLVEDRSHQMQRVEVKCAKCGGHLGHVFNDAPDQPTGLRFCINSVSLDFTPLPKINDEKE